MESRKRPRDETSVIDIDSSSSSSSKDESSPRERFALARDEEQEKDAIKEALEKEDVLSALALAAGIREPEEMQLSIFKDEKFEEAWSSAQDPEALARALGDTDNQSCETIDFSMNVGSMLQRPHVAAVRPAAGFANFPFDDTAYRHGTLGQTLIGALHDVTADDADSERVIECILKVFDQIMIRRFPILTRLYSTVPRRKLHIEQAKVTAYKVYDHRWLVYTKEMTVAEGMIGEAGGFRLRSTSCRLVLVEQAVLKYGGDISEFVARHRKKYSSRIGRKRALNRTPHIRGTTSGRLMITDKEMKVLTFINAT